MILKSQNETTQRLPKKSRLYTVFTMATPVKMRIRSQCSGLMDGSRPHLPEVPDVKPLYLKRISEREWGEGWGWGVIMRQAAHAYKMTHIVHFYQNSYPSWSNTDPIFTAKLCWNWKNAITHFDTAEIRSISSKSEELFSRPSVGIDMHHRTLAQSDLQPVSMSGLALSTYRLVSLATLSSYL